GYTREWYLGRIAAIRRIIPGCGISTDMIAGFCGETEEEHQDTIRLMNEVQYDFAFMFIYSERPKTLAERKFKDDVPEDLKQKRLAEIVALQRQHSEYHTRKQVGSITKVLIEGESKKSPDMLMGRNSQNSVVVFPKDNHKRGDYVLVKVTSSTASTLIGEVVELYAGQ
ncbi:MAG: TRAM domain-containing protein, partial [Bacteroidota bacterium]